MEDRIAGPPCSVQKKNSQPRLGVEKVYVTHVMSRSPKADCGTMTSPIQWDLHPFESRMPLVGETVAQPPMRHRRVGVVCREDRSACCTAEDLIFPTFGNLFQRGHRPLTHETALLVESAILCRCIRYTVKGRSSTRESKKPSLVTRLFTWCDGWGSNPGPWA